MAETEFDIAIAGGGLSGCTAAHRLRKLAPGKSIIVVEQEPRLGGRLRPYRQGEGAGYGLTSMSIDLFDYCTHDWAAPDVNRYQLIQQRVETIGLMVGSKLSTVRASDVFSEESARCIGGVVAAREWSLLQKHLDNDDPSTLLSQVCKLAKKEPLAPLLYALCPAVGIPDPTSITLDILRQRRQWIHSRPVFADTEALISGLIASSGISTKTQSRILSVKRNGKGWLLNTATGILEVRQLLVAQSPWDASAWLPKDLMPSNIAALMSKTRPVSTVTLTCDIEDPGDTPDIILVISEGIQATIQRSPMQLTLQATIDFEMSLQAPDVLKAIRRLKRAKKKLEVLYPMIAKASAERLALLPVAWAQSPVSSERRWLEKGASQSTDATLGFIGEAYGTDYHFDHNIVSSMEQCLPRLVAYH